MTDINSLIKTEDLDNISDNELYEIETEKVSSASDADSISESENDTHSSENESEYESDNDNDSDSSVEFHDLDDYNFQDNDEIIKSKNEILNEPIPDIANIKDISINLENQKYMKLGKVYKKIASLNKVIIESDISGNEYIIDISKAVLFKIKDNDTKVIGLISEIFGPITKPYYTISFKTEDLDIFNDIDMRDNIYILIDDNFKLIKTSNIKLLKGSDASNFNDEEVLDDKDIEFSDDEKEREWKKQQKNKKNNNGNKVEKGYVSRSSRNTNSNGSILDEKSIKDLDVNKLKMILGPAVVKKQVVPKVAPKATNNDNAEQQELIQKLNSLPKEELLNLITQMNNQNQQPKAQLPYQQPMNNQQQYAYPGYNMGYANPANMYPYMMQQYQQYPQQVNMQQQYPQQMNMPQQYHQQGYNQGLMGQQYPQQQFMQQGNPQMNQQQGNLQMNQQQGNPQMNQQQGNPQMNQQQGTPQMNNHQQSYNGGKSGYTFGQGLNQR
ncbi:hypothetical protein FOG51_02012 [Hanseniaspora uvarum]|nr:hypothetical protein FOG51_02012 [Hanseniaspora uvarum]